MTQLDLLHVPPKVWEPRIVTVHLPHDDDIDFARCGHVATRDDPVSDTHDTTCLDCLLHEMRGTMAEL